MLCFRGARNYNGKRKWSKSIYYGMISYFLLSFLLLYCFSSWQHCINVKHWSPVLSGNLSSFLAGFLLHLAPASLKENKTSDTYSNNAIADQQSVYTMVSYP